MDMPERLPNAEKLGQRLKKLRALMKRSLRDCASILDMPVADYLAHENGQKSFSLPQIELLSLFLGVSPDSILKDLALNTLPLHYLNDDKRGNFQQLRRKMIRSRLALFREKAGISLETLSNQTKIPLETLKSYENTDLAIPISHLDTIAKIYNQPLDSFVMTEFAMKYKGPDSSMSAKKDPFDPEEEMYHDLAQGLRKIPKEDLARLAKTLLNTLKKR